MTSHKRQIRLLQISTIFLLVTFGLLISVREKHLIITNSPNVSRQIPAPLSVLNPSTQSQGKVTPKSNDPFSDASINMMMANVFSGSMSASFGVITLLFFLFFAILWAFIKRV